MFDIGKLIGGPDEGDGVVGALLNMFAIGGGVAAIGAGNGLFDGVGGGMDAGFSTAAEGFGEVAGGLGEGIFGRAAAMAAEIGQTWLEIEGFDWLANRAYHYFSGNTKAAWGTLSASTQEVITAHAFIRQQLREQGLDALAGEYVQLGKDLPSEELLRKTFRALSKELHPDKNPLNEALMKTLSAANDTLKDSHKRTEYDWAKLVHGETMEEFLAGFDKAAPEWQQKFEETARAERIAKGHLLKDASAGTRATEGGFKHWIGGLSNGQKTGLVFAGVATVGLGVVLGLKIAEHRKKKSHQPAFGQIGPNKVVDSVSMVDRVHTQEPNLFAQHRS